MCKCPERNRKLHPVDANVSPLFLNDVTFLEISPLTYHSLSWFGYPSEISPREEISRNPTLARFDEPLACYKFQRKKKQLEIGRRIVLLRGYNELRGWSIILQTKIGGGVCLRVNNHSLPARFREKMQNLAALHRSRGWLFIETAVASPVPDSSPVTFAENFHLVIVLA